MRKIILFMLVSMDGLICGEKNELDWEIQDDAIGEYLLNPVLKQVDTMLLGRNLYKGFEQVWPAMAQDPTMPPEVIEFANWIENTHKIVFSSFLEDAGWKNAELAKVKNDADIKKAVTKIKKQAGKDILVFGGAQFAQTLLKLGLVDELRLKVQPITLGKGKPLFVSSDGRQELKLVDSKAFESGVVTLTYKTS